MKRLVWIAVLLAMLALAPAPAGAASCAPQATTWPCWTTATRPSGGQYFLWGYNSDNKAFELWNGAGWTSGPLTFSAPGNNINYTGATIGPATSYLYQPGGLLFGIVNGKPPNNFNGPYNITFSDTADLITNPSAGGLLAYLTLTASMGSGYQGTRVGMLAYPQITGAPTYQDSTTNYQVVGGTFQVRAAANMGGSGGAWGIPNWRGSIFGINPNVFTSGAAATNYYLAAGDETDLTITAGSSAAQKIGKIVQLGQGDAVRGSFDDSGIEIGKILASDTGTWKYGLSFGGYANQWAFANDSTLIMAQQRQVPTTNAPIALNGIDFTKVAFSGAPILMPLMTPPSSSDTCTQGAMKWDASFIYVCVATNTWKRATLTAF